MSLDNVMKIIKSIVCSSINGKILRTCECSKTNSTVKNRIGKILCIFELN